VSKSRASGASLFSAIALANPFDIPIDLAISVLATALGVTQGDRAGPPVDVVQDEPVTSPL
jgi:hypothetical protein